MRGRLLPPHPQADSAIANRGFNVRNAHCGSSACPAREPRVVVEILALTCSSAILRAGGEKACAVANNHSYAANS